MSFKGFFFLFLALTEIPFKDYSVFSSGGHSVQRRGTILAILVEGYPRNISVKIILKSGH